MNPKTIEQLKKYLLSAGTENSSDDFVHGYFREIFQGKYTRASEALDADGYVEGKLIIELKTDAKDIYAGLYQGLHYHTRGLTFTTICVISQKFIGLWRIKDLPEFVNEYADASDNQKAPNEVGRINARKTNKGQKNEILESAAFKILPQEFEDQLFVTDPTILLSQFSDYLKNLEAGRLQIRPSNFITKIQQLERFFPQNTALSAIHCFYAMVGYWDVNSEVVEVANSDDLQLIDLRKKRGSEALKISPRFHEAFKKFVQNHYVFVNSGSGLTADYYFSRFDEVISRLDEQYAIQHGIFFTDDNLSKFALWFVHQYYEKKLSDKYIVLDPAGGSGNLVTSWRGHLKHKIVSELQPDLLRTIEQRMKLDPEEIQAGFTIIPKTSENEGLNFLDKSAESYLQVLLNGLREKNLKLDKPIAFLLNPPYKNTDENENVRIAANAVYQIDPTILQLTGDDAGKERYLAFLAQIVNIARLQMGDRPVQQMDLIDIQIDQELRNDKKETPLIMIFTPTSWLIPRPTYRAFREEFDKYFKFEKGFLITGNEFFKIDGRFPISFTIWSYVRNENVNKNEVKVLDLTPLEKNDLVLNWNADSKIINTQLVDICKKAKLVNLSASRTSIKEWANQSMYDFKRDPTKKEIESRSVYGGLSLNDERRGNKKTYGIANSIYLGFMDDTTPVRIKADTQGRITNQPNRVWFRLDNDFKSVNKTRILSGPPDKYGYCAFDINTAKIIFSWFAITKAINGVYPVWANQMDLWIPEIESGKERNFYSLCFAFGFSNNNCIVTKFEARNPIPEAPEAFADNPLSPNNPDSFWSTTLEPYVAHSSVIATQLINKVRELYSVWNQVYCKGQVLKYEGLKDEPYFKYFLYAPFLTPNSGLTQIKKYAEMENATDLLDLFAQISTRTKKVKEEIYRMLVEDFKYFE